MHRFFPRGLAAGSGFVALGLLAMTLGASTAAAQERQAFVGARLYPVSSPIPEDTLPENAVLEDAVLILEDGRILAVGRADQVTIPAQATVTDLQGKVIIPGLVDTHSHIGGGGAADRSSPIQPGVRVLDSIDVRDPSFRRARAGGLTTVNIMPGSGHLISGQTAYLKLRAGGVLEDLLLLDGEGRSLGGLKMANGTNSRKDPPFPGTRGKSAALVREKFIAAQEYRRKRQLGSSDPSKMPARDLDLEALVEVMAGKRVVHHHTHRHDDILTVLRLAKEFGFRVVLHHVSEGWKVADEIAAAGVPCSIIVLDSPGGKLEARDLVLETGGILERAGVAVAIHTDDGITDSRLFLRSAALAVRGGMSPEGALRALTLEGAKMLDLDSRVGSLEVGKDADFVVLSGPPFAIDTQVLQTWVEGKKVFDRSDPEDLLYATGGFGAGNPGGSGHEGCLDEEEVR